MPEPRTYTQEEFDAQVEERNKALELKARELVAEAKRAKEEARAIKEQMFDLEQQMKAHKVGVSADELERLRREVRADYDKQYTPVKEQLEQAIAENRRLKLDTVVKAEMAKAGARHDRIEALYKLTAGEYDLTDDGKPMLRERPGTPLERFVGEELKVEYPEFFEGTGSSGGGAAKSSASGAYVRVIPASDPVAIGNNAADIASGKAVVR